MAPGARAWPGNEWLQKKEREGRGAGDQRPGSDIPEVIPLKLGKEGESG